MKKMLVVLPLALLLVLAAAPLAAASPASRAVPPRLRGHSSGTSLNWSGYDATRADNPGTTFTSVKASWTVPSVISSTAANAYSSTWVGLDGDGSSSVEQIGTDSDYVNGHASYYAWYEMYPKMPRNLKLRVKAGDQISASVTVTPGKGKKGSSFTLTLTDTTTHKSFTTTQRYGGAKLYSAEAIVEAPWSGGVLPLADFGQVSFTDAAFNGDAISDFNNNAIEMVDSSGLAKATPSGLTNGGTAFTVTWVSN